MEGTEILSGRIEQLKNLVIKRLTTPPPPPPPSAAVSGAESLRRIYLLCEKADEEAVEPLQDFLYEQGFEVKVPAFDGDDDRFEEIHQENLRLCDAVLIYFGEASSQWVEFKLLDLLKAPGYGRAKPWLSQGVYVAPPDNRRKQRFKTRSALMMRQDNDFDPTLLAPFIQPLQPNPAP